MYLPTSLVGRTNKCIPARTEPYFVVVVVVVVVAAVAVAPVRDSRRLHILSTVLVTMSDVCLWNSIVGGSAAAADCDLSSVDEEEEEEDSAPRRISDSVCDRH